jgi:hypothetical protein
MSGEDIFDKRGTSQHGSVREISHPQPDDPPQGQLAATRPLGFDLGGSEALANGTDAILFVLHLASLGHWGQS